VFEPEPATSIYRRVSLTIENKSEIDFAQRFRRKPTELLEQPKNKTGQNVIEAQPVQGRAILHAGL
jgi:hypothetical protein